MFSVRLRLLRFSVVISVSSVLSESLIDGDPDAKLADDPDEHTLVRSSDVETLDSPFGVGGRCRLPACFES